MFCRPLEPAGQCGAGRHTHTGWRGLILLAVLSTVVPGARGADVAADVGHILGAVRQDSAVPKLDYLQASQPINADCAYYLGRYRDIEIKVETHPNSNRVASILLEIPGGDQTRLVLPAVSKVLGPPHSRDPKHSAYGWEWPDFRTASVHYAAGEKGKNGLTIVSIFYR